MTVMYNQSLKPLGKLYKITNKLSKKNHYNFPLYTSSANSGKV